MIKKEDNNRLLSVCEVSKLLCIPLKSVYYLTQTAKIKGIKIGKHWRYHSKDIEEYYHNGTYKYNIVTYNKEYPAEKRAFPRLNCNILCDCKVLIPSVKEVNSKGSIRNISGNGVFLLNDPKNLEIGDPVDLDFCLGLNKGFQISGRIVRKVQEGIGIKFRNLQKHSQESIINYVG